MMLFAVSFDLLLLIEEYTRKKNYKKKIGFLFYFILKRWNEKFHIRKWKY